MVLGAKELHVYKGRNQTILYRCTSTCHMLQQFSFILMTRKQHKMLRAQHVIRDSAMSISKRVHVSFFSLRSIILWAVFFHKGFQQFETGKQKPIKNIYGKNKHEYGKKTWNTEIKPIYINKHKQTNHGIPICYPYIYSFFSPLFLTGAACRLQAQAPQSASQFPRGRGQSVDARGLRSGWNDRNWKIWVVLYSVLLLLHVIACYYMLLHVIACYCMFLHVIACFCMLLHIGDALAYIICVCILW